LNNSVRAWVATGRPLSVPVETIGTREGLRAFAASPAFVSSRPLLLRIAGMDESEALAATERLNADRAECGCSLGARAMTAGFVLALVLLALEYGAFTVGLLVRLPVAFAAAFVAAIVGKVFGIALGRRRARREVRRILAALPGGS
jgi:hypothetical protein